MYSDFTFLGWKSGWEFNDNVGLVENLYIEERGNAGLIGWFFLLSIGLLQKCRPKDWKDEYDVDGDGDGYDPQHLPQLEALVDSSR